MTESLWNRVSLEKSKKGPQSNETECLFDAAYLVFSSYVPSFPLQPGRQDLLSVQSLKAFILREKLSLSLDAILNTNINFKTLIYFLGQRFLMYDSCSRVAVLDVVKEVKLDEIAVVILWYICYQWAPQQEFFPESCCTITAAKKSLGFQPNSWSAILGTERSTGCFWVAKTGIKGGEMTSISDPTCVVPSFPKLERSHPQWPSVKHVPCWYSTSGREWVTDLSFS